MAWGRLDDSIIDHPKFAALATSAKLRPVERVAAVGLWTKGNAYSSKHLTDGFIPRVVVPILVSLPPATAYRLADALVAAKGRSKHGLWEEAEDGYQVHDWADWNRSREKVEAVRSAKREAGRIGGRRSGQARKQAQTQAHSEPDAKHGGSVVRNSHPIPINPLPPEAPASQARYGRQDDGSYRLHDGMFNQCEAGRAGLCVKTEHLGDVPKENARQCREHR